MIELQYFSYYNVIMVPQRRFKCIAFKERNDINLFL